MKLGVLVLKKIAEIWWKGFGSTADIFGFGYD